MIALTKMLSANDIGQTKSHQVGILVPKHGGFLGFFPPLTRTAKNPSELIPFKDPSGTIWTFRFVYYNNKRFGGTRNEYRLTRMTGFFRQFSPQPRDGLILTRDAAGQYSVQVRRNKSRDAKAVETVDAEIVYTRNLELTFDKDWNLVEFKE